MNSFYKVDTELLNNISSNLSNEKTSFVNGTRNIFSTSYLANCSDSTIQSMKKKLNEQYSTIEKSYNSIANWLNDYISDANSVEQCLISGKNNIKDSEVSKKMDSILKNKEVEIEVSPVLEELINKKPKYEKLPLITNKNSGPSNSFETLPFITGPNEKQNKVELYNETVLSSNKIIDGDQTNNAGTSPKNIFEEGIKKTSGFINENADHVILTSPEKVDPFELYEKDRALFITLYGEDGISLVELCLSLGPIEEELDKEIDAKKVEIDKVTSEMSKYGPPSRKGQQWDKEKKKKYYELQKQLDDLNQELEDLKAQKSELGIWNKNLTLAIKQQFYENHVLTSDEYKKYSEDYISKKVYDDIDWDLNLQNPTAVENDLLLNYEYYKDHNMEDSWRQTGTAEIGIKGFEINIADFYDYATQEEKNMYHYLYKKYGMDKANYYASLLADRINQSKGRAEAEKRIFKLSSYIDSAHDDNYYVQAAGCLMSYFDVKWEALGDGINQFFEGLDWSNPSCVLTAKDYERMYYLQYIQENTDILDKVYNFNTQVGRMLPCIALGMTLSAAGFTALGWVPSALAGASVTGTTVHQELVKGTSKADAWRYAIAVGCTDALADRVLGTIPGIGKATGYSLRNMAKNGLGEVLEDYMNEILKVSTGEDIDLGSVTKESFGTFLTAMLLSGYTNLGTTMLTVTIDGTTYKDVHIKDVIEVYKTMSEIKRNDPNYKNSESLDLTQVLAMAAINTKLKKTGTKVSDSTAVITNSDALTITDSNGVPVPTIAKGRARLLTVAMIAEVDSNIQNVKGYTIEIDGEAHIVTSYYDAEQNVYFVYDEVHGTRVFNTQQEVDDYRKDRDIKKLIDYNKLKEDIRMKIEKGEIDLGFSV